MSSSGPQVALSTTGNSTTINDLLNWGARIGASAYFDGVKSSQLENIIATLDAIQGREALLLVATFAQRQSKRLGSGRNLARIITEAMLDLYEKGLGKDEARIVLGTARWVFDAFQGARKPRLEDLSKLTLKELLSYLVQSSR